MLDRRQVVAAIAVTSASRPALVRDRDIRDVALEKAFDDNAPPALAAAIVTRNGLEWSGVRGVRQFGAGDHAMIDDVWHLGSCTKAMTALLYGRLVEQGIARWELTVPQLFPTMTVHPGWRKAAVKALLMHRAGMSDTPCLTGDWIRVAQRDTSDLRQQRRELIARVVAEPPTHAPTTLKYSSLDYIAVGAAIEAIVGES